MTTAFASLRHHARTHQVKLTDVALAVVRGELIIEAVRPSAGAPPHERARRTDLS
jgi:hypothetical protein